MRGDDPGLDVNPRAASDATACPGGGRGGRLGVRRRARGRCRGRSLLRRQPRRRRAVAEPPRLGRRNLRGLVAQAEDVLGELFTLGTDRRMRPKERGSLDVSRCVGCKSAGMNGAGRGSRETKQNRSALGLTRRKTYQRVVAGGVARAKRKRGGPFLLQAPLSFVSRPPTISGYLPHCGRDGTRGGRGEPRRSCQRSRSPTTPRRRATTRPADGRRPPPQPRRGGTTWS